jgi:lysophospholipase L1-like esterase
MSDSLNPRFSWPGVQIAATFTGTSIGVRLADHTNYYNVYIDGIFHNVFHGTLSGDADYVLAKDLPNTRHTLLFSRRNITFDEIYSFSGFILDDGAELLPPPSRPSRKIEFIGDSFTAAESNEATEQELPWEARFPVTNIDKGFAPLIARHFNAEHHTTCRSGSGLYCDWQGNTEKTIPKIFDHTLMDSNEPKWNFAKWIPDVVVVCLGLNDHSGLRDKDGKISEGKSALFRKTYHDFLTTIRSVYPNVRIVAVAAFPEWIQENVRQVVEEEKSAGKRDVWYAHFDEFKGGYVANGHPTVATHQKMAHQIIESIELFNVFPAHHE